MEISAVAAALPPVPGSARAPAWRRRPRRGEPEALHPRALSFGAGARRGGYPPRSPRQRDFRRRREPRVCRCPPNCTISERDGSDGAILGPGGRAKEQLFVADGW